MPSLQDRYLGTVFNAVAGADLIGPLSETEKTDILDSFFPMNIPRPPNMPERYTKTQLRKNSFMPVAILDYA